MAATHLLLISVLIVRFFPCICTSELCNIEIVVQHSRSAAPNSTLVKEENEDTRLSLRPRMT